MIPGLPLAFTYPWLLAALLLLPAIWWLLRFTPPRPSRIAFPPTRILLEIDPREETPSTTPWWLLLLRIVIAGLVILALAQPVLNPPAVSGSGSGPLMVVLDDGWGSAQEWERIAGTADQLLAQAETDDRPVLLVATASDETVGAPSGAAEAREHLAGLDPSPHAPDRGALAGAVIEAIEQHGIEEVAWMSDGLEHGTGSAFAERLAGMAGETGIGVVRPESGALPLALAPALNAPDGLTVEVVRASEQGRATGEVLARDLRGRVVGQVPFTFEAGANTANAEFDLPVEIRNDIARIEIAEENSSGSVQLLDERWRRRVVGLVSGETNEGAQPLLSPLYYITRALAPFADLREPRGSNTAQAVDRLLDENVSALVLADIGTLVGDSEGRIEEWVNQGGVLIRFAGPRLAGNDPDNLLPTPLRGGERELGGTLSWSEPQALAGFAPDGPFAGLEVPPDVRVSRQVLAQPAADLAEKTWASLADGTPLVTGARRGDGWVVLFHVTADAAWSDLPLSGAFVEMLRRVVELAGTGGNAAGAQQAEDIVLRPLRTLDASGTLLAPPGWARPIQASAIGEARPDADHPPGLYGEPDAFRALNVIGSSDDHAALSLPDLPVSTYPADDPRVIGPWLLLLALALLIADGLAVLSLGGYGPRRARLGRAAAGMLAALAVLAAAAPDARAQSETEDALALAATLETPLAYVLTGNGEIDETSRAGLVGLSQVMANRTALEPAEPIGLDLTQDELAFFPLIYWPIDHAAEAPSAEVLAKVDAYMKQGGTILFDTRDELETRPGPDGSSVGPGMLRLRAMMRGLDIPQLEPTPADHVLTKAFYLLQEFPGRWEGGTLWVEASLRDPNEAARPARNADGVSAILITSNDLAGAWAVDDSGRPLYPVSPGGDWQREMAFRAGVNIVMYALTGNYKADQVHVPALLERLGQ